jgi:phosphatidylglycerophosphatase A
VLPGRHGTGFAYRRTRAPIARWGVYGVMPEISQNDVHALDSLGTSRTTKGIFCYRLSIWFGAGLAPLAPGTVATLTCLPLYWLFKDVPWIAQLIAVLGFGVFAILCADRTARDLHLDDPQVIVIDEVAGGLLALVLVASGDVSIQLIVLALFRLLDILKPWPINLTIDPRTPGLEIVYDDVAAGLIAGVAVKLAMPLFH